MTIDVLQAVLLCAKSINTMAIPGDFDHPSKHLTL